MHELIARQRRRTRSDEGFTLIELVITVSIVGIIVVGLSGMVLSYFRNTVDTSARLTASHDVQFAAAYWQRDVASIGVRSATYDSSASVHSFPLEQSVAANGNTGVTACAVPSDASAVVTLAWTEYPSPTSPEQMTTVKVTYASRPNGTRFELIRVRCGTQPSTRTLADNLDAAPTVACPGGCNGSGASVPDFVTMSLSTSDPEGQGVASYLATLTGERRQT